MCFSEIKEHSPSYSKRKGRGIMSSRPSQANSERYFLKNKIKIKRDGNMTKVVKRLP
jgi:hypothetical protein